jgi:hypothetical protein
MRGPFRPCLSAWCGPCYKPLGHKKYPVMVQLDDDGEVIRNPGDETLFMEARAGDHLMTQFQCETCHFRNIMGRDPLSDVCDGD